MTGFMNSKSGRRASAALLALFVLGLVLMWGRAHSSSPATYMTLEPSGEVGRAALSAAAEPLFDEDSVGTTQALLVMRNGKPILERYGE